MFRIPDGKPVHSPPTKKRTRRQSPSKRACETQKAKQVRRAFNLLAFVFGALLIITQNTVYKSLAVGAACAYITMLIKDYLEKSVKGKMTSNHFLPLIVFMLLGVASAYIVLKIIATPNSLSKMLEIASSTPLLVFTPLSRTLTPEATSATVPVTGTVTPDLKTAVPPTRTKREQDENPDASDDVSPTAPGATVPPTEPPATPPTIIPTEPTATQPPVTEPPNYNIYHKHFSDGTCKQGEFPIKAIAEGWEAGPC